MASDLTAAGPPRLRERILAFYRAHEPACAVGLFAAGFLFDTLFVGRIDRLENVVHQATYLALCALLISLEIRELHGAFEPPERLRTAWRYHVGATHFMLGTLLNIYTLFYFKSASAAVSLLFLLSLCAILAVNELKPFPSSGATLRMTLFSLCLVSYFGYLVPMAVGRIGPLPFLGSLAASAAVVAAVARRLRGRLADRPQVVWRHVALPFAVVEILFAALYFEKAIPPVPLSLSSIGIYHDIRREGGAFLLTTTRPRWKFWQRGDQTFLARPGDAVWCYVSVFSPTRFRERLQVRWNYRDPAEGWREADAIPLDIVGGRDEGWRGFTAKRRWKPGRWRVRVETSDGRELGRIGFDVLPDATTDERPSRTLVR